MDSHYSGTIQYASIAKHRKMTIGTICTLLVGHFVADFLLQSRETALNKSRKLGYLLSHVGDHIWVFAAASLPLLPTTQGVIFCLSNALLHGLTDWYIWRFYKWYRQDELPSFKYWEDSLFYTIIGLDQLIHMVCMFSLFNLCK